MVSKTIDQDTFGTASHRYWVGSIITYLLIPLVLLISGWDPGWYQGWFYSALIIAVISELCASRALSVDSICLLRGIIPSGNFIFRMIYRT